MTERLEFLDYKSVILQLQWASNNCFLANDKPRNSFSNFPFIHSANTFLSITWNHCWGDEDFVHHQGYTISENIETKKKYQ